MKIPLKFDIENGLFYFPTIIKIPRFYKGFITLKVFYDSGSKITLLSEKDANILRIDIQRIPPSQNIYGWGGNSLASHLVKDVEFSVKTANNEIVKLQVKELYITESRKRDEKVRYMSMTSPSIVGNDFLIVNKLRAVLEPLGESYLESVEEEKK